VRSRIADGVIRSREQLAATVVRYPPGTILLRTKVRSGIADGVVRSLPVACGVTSARVVATVAAGKYL